jgi:hypothetical protein
VCHSASRWLKSRNLKFECGSQKSEVSFRLRF